MKVKAFVNMKDGNGWHNAGDVFEIPDAWLSSMAGLVEKVGEDAFSPAPAPVEDRAEEERPKRSAPRRRKE